eukprot:CAMPEP_0172694950 /NCGR_PEP_ID=MMETSP1074-20121228/27019_1 /TAXON_ID=2916 /ORGANISM="Ceratium fusus, Strain PA161109" /LENGTH=51 /DNA_ID=CAMNT_0013515507 /DNA_START=32 /DNA_END=184 /DNA_ORIENTATION=-
MATGASFATVQPCPPCCWRMLLNDAWTSHVGKQSPLTRWSPVLLSMAFAWL